MNVFHLTSRIVITCPKRIVPYLKMEIETLGYIIDDEWMTGLSITGTMNDCIRLNLMLRTGYQVLFLIKEFVCKDAEALYQVASTIEWEDIVDTNGYVCVTSNVDNETIQNNLFANVKLKDAIVDRIKLKKRIRPDSGPDRSRTVIHLYWKDTNASVFIDTSGETLSKHNYRKIPGKAPMQESLAAATILATKWDVNTNFVNPMCGSGTLAIEAALMALDRAPGLLRTNYGFMHIKGYDEESYIKEMELIKKRVKKKINIQIIATDIDPKIISIARINAQYANVDQYIQFSVCDFSMTDVPPAPGVVMMNPEYGERLGEYEELEKIYKSMGDFLKQKCKGYKGYILTASPNLAKKVGLKADRKIEFYNSKLDCRLLEYDIYEGTKRQ